MKKLFYLFLITTTLFFMGCAEKVYGMTDKKESFGKSIEFYKDDKIGKTEYLLLIPDSYLGVRPTLRIYHYTDGLTDNTQIIENVQVGEIYRENGVIKSIVINDKKYVNK